MIRWARAQDADNLGQVFYAAVREGPSPYTEAQRAAWMDQPPQGADWAAHLAPLEVAVAEDHKGAAIGFMSVEPGGYIDRAFILPAHHGTGVFRKLYDHIEGWARNAGEARLWTHASLMAQPAFRAMGFSIIHHETVERNGESLTRAKMEKTLA